MIGDSCNDEDDDDDDNDDDNDDDDCSDCYAFVHDIVRGIDDDGDHAFCRYNDDDNIDWYDM